MTTRRINLLPPEREQRRRARQTTTTIVAAGVALVVLLALVFVAEIIRLHGQTNALQAQQAKNAELQSEIAQLSQFQQLDTQLQQKTALLKNITQDEVRWSIVLADVSLVIPSDTWLTNFTATQATTSATQSGAGAQTSPAIGTIQLTGTTFSHLDVAKWLTRLAGVDAFTNPYLSLSSKGVVSTTTVVNFNSTVDLSDKALRRNQAGAERRP
jgi:type IV pilus assembly protein PilN